MSNKIVIWIELTSPWEENMAIRHMEKKEKYNQLKIDCEAKGWRVHPFEVEVGCRGYVAESFHYTFKKVGFSKQEIKELKQELAMHDSLSGRNRVSYDQYSEEQRYSLAQKIKVRLRTSAAHLPVPRHVHCES